MKVGDKITVLQARYHSDDGYVRHLVATPAEVVYVAGRYFQFGFDYENNTGTGLGTGCVENEGTAWMRGDDQEVANALLVYGALS